MIRRTWITALIATTTLAAGCASTPADPDPSTGSSAGDSGPAPSDTEDGTSDSTSDNSSDSSGDDFVPKDDTPTAASCDPLAQDCPEGEKCIPYINTGDTWDANKCVPVKGDGTAGDVCVTDSLELGTDDCDADHLCWQLVYDDMGSLVGTCLPFCSGDLDDPVCPESRECQVTNDGTVTVCVEACDPLLQDCGLEGVGCYIVGGESFFTCQPVSGGYDEDQPCVYTNDCLPGLFCSAGEAVPGCTAGGCCTSYCDVNEADACSAKAGTECVPFFDTPQPLYETLGVCISPL